MKTNTNLCVNLKTVMQNDVLLSEGQCYTGVLTRDGEDHFRFEEEIRKGRPARNPKLFDGKYISMVRMQNGKYHCHLKTFTLEESTDKSDLAFRIYCEISNALKIVE